MRRFAIMVAALMTAALVAAASTASADVSRYQPTATLTVSLTAYPGFVHTFTIAWTNPCGTSGAFTGTGHGSALAGGANETIAGTLAGGRLTFTAVYTSFIPGYTWTNSMFANTWTVEAITSYRNHGDYVKQMGGGPD